MFLKWTNFSDWNKNSWIRDISRREMSPSRNFEKCKSPRWHLVRPLLDPRVSLALQGGCRLKICPNFPIWISQHSFYLAFKQTENFPKGIFLDFFWSASEHVLLKKCFRAGLLYIPCVQKKYLTSYWEPLKDLNDLRLIICEPEWPSRLSI